MAKSTRGWLSKDDPTFKEGPQVFVPAPRPPVADKAQTTSEHPLAKMQRELVQEWRDSGLTVVETEESDGQELTASIPMGKRPKPKPSGLREAYRAALYSVELDGQPCALRVDQRSDAVCALLQSLGSDGAAFITAHNPASLDLGLVHNTMADRALRRDLKTAGAQAIKGSGVDSSGKWPAETSYLVTGLSRADAETIARRYGQYAMLWIEADGTVNLVELSNLDRAVRYPLKVPPFAWVKLGFEWGYEWTTLRLKPRQWLSVLQGDSVGIETRQWNDGERFTVTWGFKNGTDLYVSYGHDGGTAYDGELDGLTLTLGERA